jgi:hypothetical protein
VEAIRKKFNLVIVNFGHAGDGNIHVNVLIDKRKPGEEERAHAAVKEVFEAALELGGTLSGEHGAQHGDIQGALPLGDGHAGPCRQGAEPGDVISVCSAERNEAWKKGGDFAVLLKNDPDIRKHLTTAQIDRCFDLRHTIKKVDYIFKRVFGKQRQ